MKTFILTLTVCAIFSVLTDAARACPGGASDCVADTTPMAQVACSGMECGDIACNSSSGDGCKVVSDAQDVAGRQMDSDCVAIAVLPVTVVACDRGDDCKVAPVSKTLLACQAGVDCVAISVLSPCGLA